MRHRLILSGVFPAALGWIMNMRADGALCLEQIGPCGPIKSRWHPSTREGRLVGSMAAPAAGPQLSMLLSNLSLKTPS